MEKKTNYTELSKQELIELVKKQQEKLDEMTPPPPNDWHSWFYTLLLIKLHDFPSVRVDREVVLGAQPQRADFVVAKEDAVVDTGLKVFQNFRKHHIIEFKWNSG